MRLWGGKCDCCEVLREEVAFLRSLIRPRPETKFNPLPVVHFEADAVLGGASEQTELSTEAITHQEEIDAERSRILSGTY